MTELLKPLSDHHFHDYPDDLLQSLVKNWQRMLIDGEDDRTLKVIINDAYKILGYRCALEYIKNYGD